jgi:hypothetical protein
LRGALAAEIMARRHYFLACAALALIPFVVFVGVMLGSAIDPEIAAGHANYARNFRLLSLAKSIFFQGTALLACGLWLICCVFLLKAKRRSYWWSPLAILGPFGLVALILLGDRTPGDPDAYQLFVGGMRPLIRAVYEIVAFVVIWFVAVQTVWLWRDLMIMRESWSTGVPAAAIIDQQNASGGMWAFGDGLEAMFLAAVLYVLRPVCFNAAGFVRNSLASSRRT